MIGGSTSRDAPKGRGRAILAAALVLVLSATASVLLTLNVRQSARNDAEQRFHDSADQLDSIVHNQVDIYIEKLRDIGSFALTSRADDRDDFSRFVKGTKIFDQLPAVTGVFFLRRVEEKDWATYTDALKADGNAIFAIGPTPEGKPHYVLEHYVAGNVDLGLPPFTDISPITTISGIIETAGSKGLGAAGSFQNDPLIKSIAEKTQFPIPLIEKITKELDFFIGLPVFDSEEGGSPSGDGAQPEGWIAAPIDRFANVVEALDTNTPAGFGMRLTMDLSRAAGVNEDMFTRAAEISGTAASPDKAPFSQPFQFDTEGIEWHLVVWSPKDAADDPAAVLLTLAGGLFASLLASGLMYLRLRAHDREREYAAELADREQFQGDILDSVATPMVVLDGAGHIMRTNPAWNALIELTPHAPTHGASDAGDDSDTAPATDEADGGEPAPEHPSKEYLSVMGPFVRTSHEELGDGLWEVLRGDTEATETDVAFEDAQHRRWYAVRATRLRGRRGGAVVIHTDITERKRSHEDLELKATRDDLTGLLNRLAFMAELESALRHARSAETFVGVIFIDLDGFKPINDTYGHNAGDNVLREVARRITGAVRTSDRVARLGGDEFVVLVSPIPDPQVVESTADRILRALDRPLAIEDRAGGATGYVFASIGVAVTESPMDTGGEDLLERADQAMYASKQAGGARVTVSS